MRIRVRKQTVTQAALTVILLTLLGAVYLARPRPMDEPVQGGAQRLQRWLSTGVDGEDGFRRRLGDLRSLPVYCDAERSLVELNAARAALLRAAASRDNEAAFLATANYRSAVERVRDALAQLEPYMDPAEFQRCLYELFMPHTEAELSGVAMQESLLGILPPVSLLPEENPP